MSHLCGPNPLPLLQFICDMKRLFISLLIPVLLSAFNEPSPEVPLALLGDPIPPAAAKTIEILPETKWVNVTGGENIRGRYWRPVIWLDIRCRSELSSFDLQQVAPPRELGLV